mmetsp:Transcript_15683/g.47764  ORF Transcript_15683/g.47764 Transcript_15683/m.47764 type:complete len:257 (+) Transcript_15683:584-1354(+)
MRVRVSWLGLAVGFGLGHRRRRGSPRVPWLRTLGLGLGFGLGLVAALGLGRVQVLGLLGVEVEVRVRRADDAVEGQGREVPNPPPRRALPDIADDVVLHEAVEHDECQREGEDHEGKRRELPRILGQDLREINGDGALEPPGALAPLNAVLLIVVVVVVVVVGSRSDPIELLGIRFVGGKGLVGGKRLVGVRRPQLDHYIVDILIQQHILFVATPLDLDGSLLAGAPPLHLLALPRLVLLLAQAVALAHGAPAIVE